MPFARAWTRILLGAAAALAASSPAAPLSAEPALVGLWEFDDAQNLGKATIGEDLDLAGAGVAAASAGVPGFPADGAVLSASNSYFQTDPVWEDNGGGAEVNRFTVVMDFSPTQTSQEWNRLFKNPNKTSSYYQHFDQAGVWLHGGNQIWSAAGSLASNEWYRAVWVVDAPANRLEVYLNGSLAASGNPEGVDGLAALDTSALQLLGDGTPFDQPTRCSAFAIFDEPFEATRVQSQFDTPGEPILRVGQLLAQPEETIFEAEAGGEPDERIALSLYNPGPGPRALGFSFSGAPVFSLPSPPATAAPGTTQTLTVAMTPSLPPSILQAKLTIASDEPATISIRLAALITGENGLVGLWEFDSPADPELATIGGDLTLEGAGATTAHVGVPGFPNDGYVRSDGDSYYSAAPLLLPNGGGKLVNRFTLLMDFAPTQVSAEWNRLIRRPNNPFDTTYYQHFDRVGAYLGISNQIWTVPEYLRTGVWVRVVWVVDTTIGRFEVYANGHYVAGGDPGGVDGPAALGADGVFLLGDSNVFDEPTECSLVAIYNRPLPARFVVRNLMRPSTPLVNPNAADADWALME